MAEREKIYQRLDSSWIGRPAQLWSGPDHLLAASVCCGLERYRRFFYRDIQAVVARRTRTWLLRGSLLGVLGGLLAAAAYWLYQHSGRGTRGELRQAYAIILSVPGGLLLVLTLIDFLRGPTAAVYVQTAAGSELLGAPRRWCGARRVLARLEPIIRAAQTGEAPV